MGSALDHLSVLAELSALAAELAPGDSPEPITVRRLAAASGFSARRIVYIAEFQVERPLIVAVLEGRKDIVCPAAQGGAQREHLVAERGDIIVFPPQVVLETSSTPPTARVPEGAESRFRSFVVEVDPEVSMALSLRHPELCVHAQMGAFDPTRPHVLHANTAALQAVLHYTRTLLVEGAHEALLRHRLEDLLLSLSLQHRAERDPQRSESRADGDLVLAVRNLVRREPQAELSAESVAQRLAVSPATLRRRLAEAGVSLRGLRTEERMALAQALLARPGAQVAEVALRCGYRSPSKFARQFRLFSGDAPRRRAG